MHVDFAGTRRGRMMRPAEAEAPERAPRRRPMSPEPSTIAAVAMLIAENAAAATIDSDLDRLCDLLRERCRWSDESLSRLRRVATLATRASRSRRDVSSA